MDEGDIIDYLGMHIHKREDGLYKFTQQQLIQKILLDLNFQESTKVQCNPVAATKVTKGTDEESDHATDWHFRLVIGKLNLFQQKISFHLDQI